MKYLITILYCFIFFNLFAQGISKTFEMRYFTNDKKANGETDFKGETEWMNIGQRIQFLNDYANYASRFFENPNFDREIVTNNEVNDVLTNLKSQPLTSIRQTIPLNSWKAYGYREGQNILKQQALKEWLSNKGTSIDNGILLLSDAVVERKIDSLIWRFRFEAEINLKDGISGGISLNDDRKPIIVLKLKDNDLTTISAGKAVHVKITSKKWLKIEIEGDFTRRRFNLSLNGKQLQYYIPFADTSGTTITKLSLQSKGELQMNDLSIINYTQSDNVKSPYFSTVVLDEDFEEKRAVDNWQRLSFDDSSWSTVDLPSVHGGVQEKEEDYYLRKKIRIGDFQRATLLMETMDPGGEIWINNQVVAVINDRHPIELDVTRYLKPNIENLIAVRVKPYKAHHPMGHTPSDPYIGWFLGRTSLLLSTNCMIKNVLVNTSNIGQSALQCNKVYIQYNGAYYFSGRIEINYYPWFPKEGGKVATFSKEIQVRPRIGNEYTFEVSIPSPMLWSCDSPVLYKVEVILKDQNGTSVDDYVTTTGIRLLEQKNGDFYLNGKPEMLNGAQIMGFRMPIETISKNNRCAPANKMAEELLMIKKMGANLLRMHVHAEQDTTEGINDPRYAELADQMGIYMIWQTAAWVRSGDAWSVDFEGYPEFMKQVYNHPSIVMWEAGNHPNKFKEHDLSDTQDYVKKIVDAIFSTDQSRLISPTSFWQHSHYVNYDGTIDYQGNKIKSVHEFMNRLVTRGSQDAYAGYGHDWSAIRKAPNEWAASCLSAKDKAYFNFEHEESIGQPNWNLCKGKPWYLLQSYEWDYDEGSIGRKLTTEEWKASQAWQAFSAWESMKKQILLGYDGFSWCTLHGGANMGTYKKPLIDNLNHPKLAFFTNKMIFQRTWAGSNDVDIVYGPDDQIKPVINHLGNRGKVDLLIQLKSLKGNVVDQKRVKNIELVEGHSIDEMEGFRFKRVPEGTYIISYEVIERK